jgi:hypothetical protein
VKQPSISGTASSWNGHVSSGGVPSMVTLQGVPSRGRFASAGQFDGAATQLPQLHVPSAYGHRVHAPASSLDSCAYVDAQPVGGAMGHVFVEPI